MMSDELWGGWVLGGMGSAAQEADISVAAVGCGWAHGMRCPCSVQRAANECHPRMILTPHRPSSPLEHIHTMLPGAWPMHLHA